MENISASQSRKQIIYIDMDDVLCSYTTAHKAAIEKNPAILYPQSQYGFYRDLAPMEGAIAAVNTLYACELADLYILTAPSIQNPLSYSEKREWVEKYLGMKMVERLIISPNKGLNKGDFLIDDHAKGRGQEHFEGQLIIFGSNDFPDWASVLQYFRGIGIVPS